MSVDFGTSMALKQSLYTKVDTFKVNAKCTGIYAKMYCFSPTNAVTCELVNLQLQGGSHSKLSAKYHYKICVPGLILDYLI